ncbi:uncharacterized protein [Dermacentor albipictus]|uniref:uncharacterized protein isoform X3 n=1 Tax=Dermacentor albipictus TaxID=60249 RepID=UPI0031FC9858
MDRCPNEGCLKELSETEIKPHLERCAYRTTRCNLCSTDVVLNSFLEHCTTTCPKRSVICKVCTAVIFAGEMQEHSKTCHSVGDKIESVQERKTAALLRRTGASYVWCLESYRILRRHAISRRDDCLSEPIFFGLAGCKFRLQANLYGIGCGAGTHMAFFVQSKVVDVARMDSCCVKKTRCLIRVASQREGVDHVDLTFDFSVSGQDRRRSTSRPLHMWNTLFGREKFILFEELEDQRVGYVVDDMLILEFHVID